MMPLRSLPCRSVNRRGSVLILVAWVLSLLAVFAVSLGVTARQQLMLSRRLMRDAVLRRAAGAGLNRARAWLAQPQEAVAAEEGSVRFWMEREDLFNGISVGPAVFSLGYFFIDDICGTPKFFYGLSDEEGKVNINTASPELMARLFEVVLGVGSTQAQGLADAVVDWRDADAGTQPKGAEGDHYEGLGVPYACKDALFNAPDELLLVRGFDATIYENIRGYVTVVGSGRLNINTVSAKVLDVLGLDVKLAGKIARYRRGPDALWGTSDDGVFMSVTSIAEDIEGAAGLTDQERVSLDVLIARGVLTTDSSHFSATCTARIPGQEGAFAVTAVFERTLTKEGYHVQPRYWRTSV